MPEGRKISHLTPDLGLTTQLRAEDFAELARRGYRSVLNNRPDGESGDPYLNAKEASAIAARHGLAYVHMPVRGADVSEEEVIEQFRQIVDSLPKPIVAHCKVGARSAVLWAYGSTGELPVDEIIRVTAGAGHDLSVLRPELSDRANADSRRNDSFESEDVRACI
ncbi:MAG: TIGR01244 family sulfur transferase [Pseudomonadota bacterium]|nr:TIGR01244 family sulfur transferase [Pseudomonadota bacterium]